jgi:hypothetical protein
MNCQPATETYTATRLNRLHDLAYAEAAALRREAIDAFLHDAAVRLGLARRSGATTARAGAASASPDLRCAH